MVVLTVEMTDLVFSLDNVVAAVSLSSKFWVVMLGVAIGILMMRFAAGLFSYAVKSEPILKKAAYILVLIIGVELLVEEIGRVDINEWLRFGLSVSAILLCLVYAHSRLLQRLEPLFVWLAHGFARVNSLVDWMLRPLYAFFRLVGRGVRALTAHAPLTTVEETENNK
jgi:tellurite resistance protein TerC